MAAPQLQKQTSMTPVDITSIQPGGGLCMSLELAWSRLRRGWLRRFRPAYVRRVAELRRGNCDNCTHDIVDARDLKLYRNVCGFHFAKDPFRAPNRLGLAHAGRTELLFFGSVLLAGAALSATLALWYPFFIPVPFLALVFLAFVVSFFRDPERAVPADTG